MLSAESHIRNPRPHSLAFIHSKSRCEISSRRSSISASVSTSYGSERGKPNADSLGSSGYK